MIKTNCKQKTLNCKLLNDRTILKVSRLRKKYLAGGPEKDIPAVRGVSFGLKKGEILVLVGESGCGKTTLLKMIAGLEDPDAGAIFLNGELVTGPSQHLVPGHPGIKLVYQDYHLSPHLTVYQNLVQALKGYEKRYQIARISQLLPLAKLENLRDHYPRELSGGEQQRVALARAMADEPALLLLDEPFSNLDELTKQPLKEAIRDTLRGSSTAAILVTHDRHDALTLADRIAVMQKGRFLQVATPRLVYQQPASPYVARFFGDANIFSAEQLFAFVQPGKPALESHGGMGCVRAEAIRICSPSESQFTGQVVRVSYAGAYEEVEVLVGNNTPLRLHGPVGLAQAGQVLPLRIQRDGIHFFKE